MAKIVDYRKIPLDNLTIGKGQIRTFAGEGLSELADSIDSQGLLQPIVVCPSEKGRDKFEILAGQRRFLAHKELKRTEIPAAVLNERVGELEAKTISITENLMRRKLKNSELIDGITFLYHRYGSVKAVAEKTGFSQSKVREYVNLIG